MTKELSQTILRFWNLTNRAPFPLGQQKKTGCWWAGGGMKQRAPESHQSESTVVFRFQYSLHARTAPVLEQNVWAKMRTTPDCGTTHIHRRRPAGRSVDHRPRASESPCSVDGVY